MVNMYMQQIQWVPPPNPANIGHLDLEICVRRKEKLLSWRDDPQIRIVETIIIYQLVNNTLPLILFVYILS